MLLHCRMRKLLVQYVKDLTAGRLASGFEHSARVYHLAREIGEGMDYDDDVLHAACFLHNIETPIPGSGVVAERARVLLSEVGFDVSKIKTVCEAIQEHKPGDHPVGVEAKLLYDASLLDAIGAIGFARLSISAFFWHHHKTMEGVLQLLRERLEQSERFCFPVSARMAREKLKFMRHAVTQFEAELAL